MPYIEEVPTMPDIETLENIHDFSSVTDSDLTADLLMGAYWLKRDDMFPIEEGKLTTVQMLLYDKDWERLTEVGINPLEDNDPRIDAMKDLVPYINGLPIANPISTNLRLEDLFQPRDKFKEQAAESARRHQEELRQILTENIVKAIDMVGLDRVNNLLELLGVRYEESDEITYIPIRPSILEGIRKVARVMSPAHRDFVRSNLGYLSAIGYEDVDDVAGT